MAIDWGPYNGHLRVGIEAVISPANPSHSDTSVDVTWKFYVDSDGWNFSDPQSLHENCDGWGGTTTNFTNNSTGGSILVDTHKETYGISYNSGSKSASANLSGAYNGATPSNSYTINLPNRPIAAPSAGEDPIAGTITSDGATINWGPPTDNGGDTVDNYRVQISTDTSFNNPAVDHTMGSNASVYTTTALQPNTHYYSRVQAHNSAGWGNWTSSAGGAFTTTSGLPTVPTGLATTSKTKDSVNLGWKASNSNGGGTVTYTVEVYKDSALTTLQTSGTTTATSMLFAGLAASTTYYVRIKAANTNGSSAWSATLTTATTGTGTYNDSGDYVALVNNLASAVADKLIHLGMTYWVGGRSANSVPTGTDTYVNMGTLIDKRGPAAHLPTNTNSGVNQFTINYPGVYEIEFAYRMDESGAAFRWNQNIYINGYYLPAYSPNPPGPKGGAVVGYESYGAAATASMRLVKITRRLDVGDTVGFGVWQNSGASKGQPTPAQGDLMNWAKVTLVGF